MRLAKKCGWLAGVSAVAVLAAGTAPADAFTWVRAVGRLSDLSAATNATDGAEAQLFALGRGDDRSSFYLILTGLDPEAAGTTYGAHVHVGPCVAGNGAAALGHFNTGTGGPPSPLNEVWLDFTVRPGGVAYSGATVPFEIAPGDAQSLVVHALPTQTGTGVAGGRIACLPVDF